MRQRDIPVRVSVAVMNTMTIAMGKRARFILRLSGHILSLRGVKAGTETGHGGMLLIGLLATTCSTCTGMALPTVSWAIPYQSSVKKMPLRPIC